jgi:hypothetical protein
MILLYFFEGREAAFQEWVIRDVVQPVAKKSKPKHITNVFMVKILCTIEPTWLHINKIRTTQFINYAGNGI